jgi:Uma2 family endonuclease
MTATLFHNSNASQPRTKLWTRKAYDRAVEAGVFGPDERLELIEGEIVCKVTMNTPRATGIRLVEKYLSRAFTEGFDIRSQLPFALDDSSEPEPDIAVVPGSPRDYELEHPTKAVLIVEVSDSTLASDRARKAGLYARAGIPEYWILNVSERRLEVYLQPAPLSGSEDRHGYLAVKSYTETESISPQASPHAEITVSDLLPRSRS